MSDLDGLDLEAVLRELLKREGASILQSPLLLEAFLRDLCFAEPALVFAVVEAVRCGVVERLLQRESEQDCVARLTSQSGLSGKGATGCVRLWSKVLPRHLYGRQQSLKPSTFVAVKGSIAEVFASIRTGGIGG